MPVKAKIVCTEIDQTDPSQQIAKLSVVSGSDFSTGKANGGIVMFIDGDVPAKGFFEVAEEGEPAIEYEITFTKVIV